MATRCLLLVLALSALCSASAVVFESIDCGSNHSFVDGNGIRWKGDNDLIENGHAQVVKLNNSISTVMDSLRVFTSRNKNCYNFKVDKGGKILVRAGFFYGNYDGLSFPPSFDLLHDGNYWSSVSTSSTEMSSYEIIYVPKGDVTSVCVAQTEPNQLPFISTLEVRSLRSNMYNGIGPDFSLRTRLRVAYGSNSIIRFPKDTYDRIWTPGEIGSESTRVVSDASVVDTTSLPDDPPQAVLLSAITTADSNTIELPTDFLTTTTSIYLNMYFSEVSQLKSSQKRSFTVLKDNMVFSDQIVPPYGSVTQQNSNNTSASSGTIFSLVATTDSTLPPIINAAEFFRIGSRLTEGTNSNDVEGLAALQSNTSGFKVLQEWRSDPCLPTPYEWEWISCTSDTIPRVTALNLNGFGLQGSLPDFSSMSALETIDLSNNSLSGNIPAFFGTLPNLKELNLAYNNFSGDIPTSLAKNTKLNLVLTGNPAFCDSGKSCETRGATGTPTEGGSPVKREGRKIESIILAGVFVVLLLLITAVINFFLRCLRRNKRPSVILGQ